MEHFWFSCVELQQHEGLKFTEIIFLENFFTEVFFGKESPKWAQNESFYVLFWCYVSCYAMFSSFYKIFMNEMFLIFCLKSQSQKNEGLKLTLMIALGKTLFEVFWAKRGHNKLKMNFVKLCGKLIMRAFLFPA